MIIQRATRGVNLYMKPSYTEDIRYVMMILMDEYHLSKRTAQAAIKLSAIEKMFAQDPDMASHDSHRQWGAYVYECWSDAHPTQRRAITEFLRRMAKNDKVI